MPVNGDRRFFPGQGCGCCSHCRCSGRCVVNGDESDENNQIAIISASPAPIPRRPTPAPPPLDDNESLLNESTQSKSIWTTLESLPHPNDMISSKNSNRSAFNSPTPLTPFVNQAMQQSRLREIPPIPNNNVVKPIAKETTTTTTKRDLNGNTSSDQNNFPGSKPLNRLASRKGLPEGGLSIEVPKQKKPSDHHSPERKHVKAKSRNMSRRTAKVDDSEEEEEKVESLRKEKSKRHNSMTTDDEEDSRHGSKNNHSKTQKNGSHRKSSKHHDHSAEEEHENEHEEDKKERKKTISHKPKLCRKHSKSGTSHLQLSKTENMGEIEVRTWAPTPQMGTFDSPKYERFNLDDEDQQDNQDDSILQQMQHQRDREWQREQDREREHFSGRDHHEDSSNHNHKSNGKSAKARSASRKHEKHADRKQHSEESDISEEEKEVKKSSKKDRQRDQDRSHKPDRKKSMRVRKKHSESEDESSEPEKKRSSSHNKHKKSTSKKKRTVHEDESEEEESHEKEESEDDHESDEESSLSETEKKKKKSSKKKTNTKHRNNSPSSVKEKEEDQYKSKEKSSSDDLEENNSNKLILTRNESQLGDFESRSNSGNLVPQPQELKHTISIGNFSITRTRMVKNANSSASLRSLSRPEQEKEGSNDDNNNNNNNNNNKENTIDIARDRIKTFLDSKMKDSKTISPKPSFSKLGMTPRSSPLNASHSDSLFVQPPPLRSTPSLSTLNAVNKLIVQHSSTQMNTLYFIDMGHIDQDGNPMVAFRIEADPNIEMNENLNNKKSKKNNNIDWLISSHESGTKLKGRLFVSAGKEGQLLYVIDIKKRHVDKFVIQSSPQHIKNFSDSPHWGNHEDYKHLYCHSPENKQLKWFIQEPGKLMRLFGRSETDHGHIYAEARLATVPPNKKTKKVTKEATLFFYEHPSQQSAKLKQQQQQNSNEKEPTGLQMDIGYLCATWWCARQTYDEGQIAAAHAEVEMIGNIEKAFEVDLLAGA